MAAELRIPITNTLTGNHYTLALSVGGTQLNVPRSHHRSREP
jgi:hypothetical protein